MYEIKVLDFYCKICGKTFNKKRGLSQHIYQLHNIKIKNYYDLYYKKSDEGKCLYCGKETRFLNLTNGYRLYCCRKCTDSDINKQNKTKQTFKTKYGVDSIFKINDVHNKGILAAQSEEAKEKRANTNIKKYGSYNVFGSNEIIKKIAKTKTKNGTRSKIELFFEEELNKKGIRYESEYYSDIYPWNCDFYLPDLKYYIELNIWWGHNNHFYDVNNIKDQETLAYWKQQSINKSQYKRAIELWTNIDIKKYNMALKNNLNYIVLWNKQDIINFLQNL